MRHVWMIAFGMLAGCGTPEMPAAPAHSPDDVPITEADLKMPATYTEAVPQIQGYRVTIRDAIAAGTPAKAHRALDELDIVLDKLPKIAKDSGVPIEQWETINTAARQLRNSFDQLHAAIDERRPPDYRSVAEPIDEAMARLEGVTK